MALLKYDNSDVAVRQSQELQQLSKKPQPQKSRSISRLQSLLFGKWFLLSGFEHKTIGAKMTRLRSANLDYYERIIENRINGVIVNDNKNSNYNLDEIGDLFDKLEIKIELEQGIENKEKEKEKEKEQEKIVTFDKHDKINKFFYESNVFYDGQVLIVSHNLAKCGMSGGYNTFGYYGLYTYKCTSNENIIIDKENIAHIIPKNANLICYPDWLDTFELLIMAAKLTHNCNFDSNKYKTKFF